MTDEALAGVILLAVGLTEAVTFGIYAIQGCAGIWLIIRRNFTE